MSKRCMNCGKNTLNPKFCTSSCAAKYNNTKYPKRKKTRTCKVCDVLVGDQRTYCDIHKITHSKIRAEKRIASWLTGEWDGSSNDFRKIPQVIRQYLLEKADYSCSKCGFNTMHPSDGKTILEINHIDGNGANHAPSNLEVLCPNCHALTDTYRGRNAGKGRASYYVRVKKEIS